jgi:hypothetical protein
MGKESNEEKITSTVIKEIVDERVHSEIASTRLSATMPIPVYMEYIPYDTFPSTTTPSPMLHPSCPYPYIEGYPFLSIPPSTSSFYPSYPLPPVPTPTQPVHPPTPPSQPPQATAEPPDEDCPPHILHPSLCTMDVDVKKEEMMMVMGIDVVEQHEKQSDVLQGAREGAGEGDERVGKQENAMVVTPMTTSYPFPSTPAPP